MNLSGLDLNLLLLLDALLRERSVTRAARRLGLSQPAASAGLARLRVALADPLFVRVPGGIEPTARSAEMGPRLQRALEDLRAAIEGQSFDPTVGEPTFVLGVVEPLAAVLIPSLLRRLAVEAPGARLELRTLDATRLLGLLDDGEIELGIGPLADPPPRVSTAELLSTEMVWVVRRDHPVLAAPSVQAICEQAHVATTHAGPARGLVDARLETLGLRRRVTATVDTFLAVPWIVASTELVGVLPGLFATAIAEQAGLATIALPPAAAVPLRLRLVWSSRRSLSSSAAWLRGCLERTVERL